MSAVCDVSADLPRLEDLGAGRGLTAEEAVTLAEELGMDQYELRFWRGWHHHMTLVILAHHFLVQGPQPLNQREGALRPTTTYPLPTPGEVSSLDSHLSLPLSVAQVRLLLRVSLPQPVLDLPAALALIAYQQRHNYATYCSHRKRLLAQLQGLRW